MESDLTALFEQVTALFDHFYACTVLVVNLENFCTAPAKKTNELVPIRAVFN